MTRLNPGLELPQFWEVTAKKWEHVYPKLKVNCTQNNQDDARKTSDDQFEDDLEMTVLFLHVARTLPPNPPALAIKALNPCLWGRGVQSQSLDRCPPHSPSVASIWNKANFPFHQPGLFIGFWVVSRWTSRHTHPSNNIIMNKPPLKA